VFYVIYHAMDSQRQAFLRGVLNAFVPPLILPTPPQPKRWLPKESSFRDDIENLRKDWCAVGMYMKDAFREHERNIVELR
jgi:hypothetical protein